MVDDFSIAQDFLFFTDDKTWRTSRPGTGKTAHEIMRQVGDENINFVQMAHCNGHCGLAQFYLLMA